MKPWQYWIWFVVGLALVLAAMGWVSVTTLRLDRAQAGMREASRYEENVRLALWRMETTIAPMLAQENARPYFVYAPFYPAEQAYNRMFEEIGDAEGVMIPSPLLAGKTPHVLLHFQIEPDARITSPQVPASTMKALSVSIYDNGSAIDDAGTRLDQFRQAVNTAQLLAALPATATNAAATNLLFLAEANFAMNAANPTLGPDAAASQPAAQQVAQVDQPAVAQQQAIRSVSYGNDWQQRAQQQVESQSKIQQGKSFNISKALRREKREAARDGVAPARVQEGMMNPVWLGDMLVLARRVQVNGGTYIQGCWLDWHAVRAELLGQLRDLFPAPELLPLNAPGARSASRVLAGLPVQLAPGAPQPQRGGGATPVRFSLVIAWCCVLLGATAVAVLMAGAVSLSERRGAFVSAVTHELRTPLTTFRMYAEMLAEGMVTDAAKRTRYLQTLCAESNRLSHLVENVLSYARLEKGRTGGQRATVPAERVVAHVVDRLRQRAEQAGMTIEWNPDRADAATLRTDLSAVEQILFNLVDNACKYAAAAGDKRIHVEVAAGPASVFIRVRDHGAGVTAAEARRLFRPFSKSAKHAAESAPGVGLGLALSRRLARQMGGDLTLGRAAGPGACFELRLPRAANRG